MTQLIHNRHAKEVSKVLTCFPHPLPIRVSGRLYQVAALLVVGEKVRLAKATEAYSDLAPTILSGERRGCLCVLLLPN